MSHALTFRRMTAWDAAMAVYGCELEDAAINASPWERHITGLSGITADAAASQVMPKSAIRSTAGFTQTVYNNILQAAAAGNFLTFNPTQCSGISPSGAKIVNTAGGLALTGLSAGFAIAGVASAIAGPITAGASLLVGLFASILSHHAAAIAKERQVICAAVPAASDSLKAIYQAVAAGTITPQQGIDALSHLLESFQQAVAPIIKMDDSHCNAACVWVKQLTAIVLKKSSDFQDMAAAQAAAAQPISGSPTSSTAVAQLTGQPSALRAELSTVPTWAWIAAAAALFLVVK